MKTYKGVFLFKYLTLEVGMSSKRFKLFLVAAAVLALTACGGAGKQEVSSTEQDAKMSEINEGKIGRAHV